MLAAFLPVRVSARVSADGIWLLAAKYMTRLCCSSIVILAIDHYDVYAFAAQEPSPRSFAAMDQQMPPPVGRRRLAGLGGYHRQARPVGHDSHQLPCCVVHSVERVCVRVRK